MRWEMGVGSWEMGVGCAKVKDLTYSVFLSKSPIAYSPVRTPFSHLRSPISVLPLIKLLTQSHRIMNGNFFLLNRDGLIVAIA